MEYGFYLAEIVDVAQPKDNRVGVRILPHMKDIDKSECPLWPSFFKDSLYTGKTGELVWVLCSDDFSIGYVFGPANYTTYPDIVDSEENTVFYKSRDNISLSMPEELVKPVTSSAAKVLGRYLSLDNVKVVYWDDNCVHYIERDTGGKIIAFKTGSFYIFRQNEMVIKIGDTVLKLDASSLSAAAKSINLQGERVGLGSGEKTAKILMTNGESAEGAFTSKSVFAS